MLIGHTTFPFFKYILKNKGDKNMTLEKNYLTNDELHYIINGLEDIDNEYDREIVKVALAIQILIKDIDWGKYKTCNEMYDAYIAQDDVNIETDVKNYYKIDEILNKENSLEKIVERFLNGLNDKIDEYSKTVDVTQLEGLLGELKKLSDGDGIENEEVLKEIKIE